MLQHIKQVLTSVEVRYALDLLADAPWSDGRASAGTQAALVKNNTQLPHECESARTLRELVLKALDTGQRVRTDISATLFLSDPDSYEGGELVVHDSTGEQRIKLAAGDMILYPSTSVHQVTPVSRGTRLACFFWIESMVRSDEQRSLLVDLDNTIQALRGKHGETTEAVALTGTYHNLLRQWADS